MGQTYYPTDKTKLTLVRFSCETTGIGDMSRRSKRLAEKEASRNDDEGKTEDRRLSAGGVMGLTAPAGTPNLRTAQAQAHERQEKENVSTV